MLHLISHRLPELALYLLATASSHSARFVVCCEYRHHFEPPVTPLLKNDQSKPENCYLSFTYSSIMAISADAKA